ncbi:MAG TPA: zinc ribbon domain-containing protein [Candidatus Binataceae bacterium]|nr:zinc ribbon domain-containing protein [Candidatus Binataceae bacterium]
MPIYEYQCERCGVFEVTQRITEDPLKRCPTCKGRVHRLISNTSFMLKGTGWYATDYGRSSSGTDSKSGSKEAVKDSSNSESGSKTEAVAADKSAAPAKASSDA